MELELFFYPDPQEDLKKKKKSVCVGGGVK